MELLPSSSRQHVASLVDRNIKTSTGCLSKHKTLLPFYFDPPSLGQPELGFRVLHHRAEPSSSQFVIHSIVIGTYSSLTAAQTAALDALDGTLHEYERAGLRGNVSKAITLVLRGLITSVEENGEEQPLSEFEIQCVGVWNETWGPRMGGEEEQALMKDVAQDSKIQEKVKLPRANPLPIPMCRENQQKYYGPAFQEELDPHWSQSRVPYFSRRDDAPFRRADDQPYSVEMGFVRQSSQPREPLITQIVVLQPDELLEPCNEEQQPNEEARKQQPAIVALTEEPTVTTETGQPNIAEEKEESTVTVAEVQPDEADVNNQATEGGSKPRKRTRRSHRKSSGKHHGRGGP